MRRSAYGIDKPLGWSYYFTRDDHPRHKQVHWWTWDNQYKTLFRWGVWGGTLYIKAGSPELPMHDFKEWFIRIPIVGKVLVLCRIRNVAQ